MTLQSHVTETVNNNGILKSKMLQMKIGKWFRKNYACFFGRLKDLNENYSNVTTSTRFPVQRKPSR